MERANRGFKDKLQTARGYLATGGLALGTLADILFLNQHPGVSTLSLPYLQSHLPYMIPFTIAWGLDVITTIRGIRASIKGGYPKEKVYQLEDEPGWQYHLFNFFTLGRKVEGLKGMAMQEATLFMLAFMLPGIAIGFSINAFSASITNTISYYHPNKYTPES